MTTIKIDGFTIEGEAVSGIGSALAIVELGICLDIGVATKAALKCGTVLISHGHQDHLACIVQHANIRTMMGGQKSRYIVPSHLIQKIQNLFKVWEDLQEGDAPKYELIPLDPGQSFDLGKGWSVRPFHTIHRIASQGYMLVETRQKLKAEYAGLGSQEIGNLRKSGTEVTEKKDVVRLAYTGDTQVEVLDNVPELTSCDVLVMEATFMGQEHSEEFAAKRGHVHLNGIVSRKNKFKNKAVLLVHFSARYEEEMILEEVSRVNEDFPTAIAAFVEGGSV